VCASVYNKKKIIEKWALAYRNFDHKDTHTNMSVERYGLYTLTIMTVLI